MKGRGPSGWPSPATEESILYAGASFCTSGDGNDNLRLAFRELIEEGLFFEVHPGLFDVPYFYCSHDKKILTEVKSDSDIFKLWRVWVEECDEADGKVGRENGMCAGQGSQGSSWAPWGPCRGDKCCCYQYGDEACVHGLKFVKHVDRR